MSTDYTNEIGYESLLSDFKRYQKQTPRGVGMTRKGQNIYLQFKTPNTGRKPYACGCTFTLDGMVEALSKSNKVSEQLKKLTSETEFWQWYEREIKQVSQLVNDLLTFGEAIKKVEDDFWSRPDRRKRKRNKKNPSDLSSWYDTYGRFYKRLPQDKTVSIEDIVKTIHTWNQGTKTFKGAVSAMKRLIRFYGYRDWQNTLNTIDVTQTEYKHLHNIALEDFINWRNKVLGITKSLHPNTHLDIRKAWLWVFSMQVVYGLRIHEVFAVANLDKTFITKDGVSIPPLDDPENTDNLIVLNGVTEIGTTTKTGYRIARPNIPPKYPNLIEILDIKTPLLPANKPRSKSYDTIRKFYCNKATEQLRRWSAPTTETHALRHLANINGMQAGIPLEVRAQSMGHTPAMNDSVYKKRQGTQTTIDLLLNSNQNAIDFVTALTSIKNLVKTQPKQKQFAAKILSIIYQKSEDEIVELL